MTLKDWLDDLLRDVRFGVRQFSRMPGFTVTALLTIALGVGANAAIFSAVYGVLLRPLPYREADRLVVSGISLPDYDDLKREAGVFAETAVWGTNQYNIDYGGETQQVPGAVVSEDFFTVLGVAALAGRTFTPADGREPVAVISTRLWKERLGGDAR